MGKPQGLCNNCNTSGTTGAHYQPQVLRGSWGSGVDTWRRQCDVPCRWGCCQPTVAPRAGPGIILLPCPHSCQGPYWPNLTRSQRARELVVHTAQPSRTRTGCSNQFFSRHVEMPSGGAHGRQPAIEWPLTVWPLSVGYKLAAAKKNT